MYYFRCCLGTRCKNILVSITITEIEHPTSKFSLCKKVKKKTQTYEIDEEKEEQGKSAGEINEDKAKDKLIKGLKKF